jgi:hypothetical protein
MSDGAFFVKRYSKAPVRFVKEVLGVENLETWQEQVLTDLAQGIQRIAVSSGHGIGKTALTAWINLWFISTRPNPQIVVTANTDSQLKTKTWRELAKWHKRSKNEEWFKWTATKFFLLDSPEDWFSSAIPWSENNSEAFAGTHEKHLLYIFDEASAIADIIWEVSEGAMTTSGALWIAFGNPTRNTGKFSQCFGKFRHRWKNYRIDSREVSITDKKQIQDWIEDYGEDSDFVRIRVKGEFPRAGTNQFISSEDVNNCVEYVAEGYQEQPVVMAVDVARFGDDQSVVCIRQGRKVFELLKWRNLDLMTTASKVFELYEEWNPRLIFIDGVGVGGGVVDRLKQLLPEKYIFEVNAGHRAEEAETYYNKRAEMWGNMRAALQGGIEIPRDSELCDDLTGLEYGFDNKNRIQLEKKEDMKRRGLASPDCGDALSMTYTKRVLKEVKVKTIRRYSKGSYMG